MANLDALAKHSVWVWFPFNKKKKSVLTDELLFDQARVLHDW